MIILKVLSPMFKCILTKLNFYAPLMLSNESFLMSWLFASGGQIIGASASVLPMNIHS